MGTIEEDSLEKCAQNQGIENFITTSPTWQSVEHSIAKGFCFEVISACEGIDSVLASPVEKVGWRDRESLEASGQMSEVFDTSRLDEQDNFKRGQCTRQ